MTPAATDSRKSLILVFTIILIDMLGVGILIPVIPLLLTDPSYPYHLHVSEDAGYLLLGLLNAIYPFMQFIATPILGQISDHFGRRPVLAFSILGTCLSYAVFAIGIITKDIPLLFLSRGLDGITGGNIAVAQASIADITTPENRAKNFGIIGAAFGIGFIVGPFLGGVLSDPGTLSWFDATTPFWFASILSFLNMLAILFFFRETLPKKKDERIEFGKSFRNVKAAFMDRGLRPLFVSSFLYQSGFSFFTTFFGVYLISRFGFNQTDIGNYFALIGICIVFTQAVITRALSGRVKPHLIVAVCLFGVSATLALIYLVRTPHELFLLTLPNAMCIGLIMANLTALISTLAKQERQGEVLGINSSVQALAQSIPPVLAGVAAAVFAPSTPIIFAAALVLVAAFVFVAFARPRKA